MSTAQAKRKVWEYMLSHTPSPGRGKYRENALNRWLDRVTVDEDACLIWSGRFSWKPPKRPIFTWNDHGHERVVSAFWFALSHWFPGESAKHRDRRITNICGKSNCVHPLCWHIMSARELSIPRRLNESVVRMIRDEPMTRSDRELADEYDVTHATIARVRSGQTWSWVGGPLRPRGRSRTRLSHDDVIDILRLKGQKRRGEVAAAYNMTPGAVWKIWQGHRWPEIHAEYHAENGESNATEQ